MRKPLLLGAGLLGLVVAGALGGSASQPAARASATGGHGEFIVRCPMTGEVQAIDPIMKPGQAAPHFHMFFGNTRVLATSTYQDLNQLAIHSNPATTCQDPLDTAAYWAPESFMYTQTPSRTGCILAGGLNECPYLPGCAPLNDGSGNYNCGTDTSSTIYIRAYYTTDAGTPSPGALPPGLIMVAGTPDATSAPLNDNVIRWDCGASTAIINGQPQQVQSPESIWPYDCAPYESDPRLNSEGLVEIIAFPSCWDGSASFTTPNTSGGPGGALKVPGYFDPSLSMSQGNDFGYHLPNQACPPQFPMPVPQLSMRIHYVRLWSVHDAGRTVYPSSCAQAENLSEPCQTEQQVYGFSGPPPDIGLELSSTQTQRQPGPWYTEHADYWQAWQQGDPLGTNNNDPNTGNLNSLTYYCLDSAQVCSFVPNANGQYPPPAG
ncbi:MAG TPA: DUF1996 domain-containing protein [Streptosporangiaceae bacterium]|nr:DUF1996 domain-containing protein [Streptosporangiaceae bacterium]